MSAARHQAMVVVLLLACAQAVQAAPADDACMDFKWDVSKERALFAGTPAALTSGKDVKSAPALMPDRLYRLRLLPQDQISFAASPAKHAERSNAHAGLAALEISIPGIYRISVDVPVWIDVVSNGTPVAARDFQGQHTCRAPHKIVEFELAGGQVFILQLSNASNDGVLLTVTASAARKL